MKLLASTAAPSTRPTWALTSARLAWTRWGWTSCGLYGGATPRRACPDAFLGGGPPRWWSWPPTICSAGAGERQRWSSARQELYRRHLEQLAPRTPARAVADDGDGHVPHPPELAGAGADHRPGGHLRLARTQADCGELLTIQAEHLRKTFGAKVRPPTATAPWWTCPPPGCGAAGPRRGWEYRGGGVRVHPAPRALQGGADLKHLPDRGAAGLLLLHDPRQAHAHVKGTEEEAVRLARRWGADEEHARRAAILHDYQVFGTGRAVAIMREIWYRTGRIGAAGRQAPPPRRARVWPGTCTG